MDGWRTRRCTPADQDFLWDMLYQSLHVPDGASPFPTSILGEPHIAHYVENFGERDGDDAQICESLDGVMIGAAWCRRLTSDDPGYGYVSDEIPELGMAVRPAWRGRGVGRRLLDDLLRRHPRMSLSVDDDNVGAATLYRSSGFEPVATDGGSTIMLRRP